MTTPLREHGPLYGDKIKATLSTGNQYIGWFIKHYDDDNSLMILEEGYTPFRVLKDAIEVLDINCIPEGAKNVGAFYTSYHQKIKDYDAILTQNKDLLKKLEESEDERNAMVLRAFAAAEAEDYCDEVIRIAELAKIPIPKKEKHTFAVEFTARMTVEVESYTRQGAEENLGYEHLHQTIKSGDYRITDFKWI